MPKIITEKDIAYICHSMLGIQWQPAFITEKNCNDILRIMSKCGSKLEIMYLLGMAYYMHKNERYNIVWPIWDLAIIEGQEAIWFVEPWSGFVGPLAPSALAMIPQYKSPQKPIHHDFGMFISNDNAGGNWWLQGVIEVEGYAVHKNRRKADEKRYEGLSYKVYSLNEETSDPQTWLSIIDDELNDDTPHF